MKYKIKKESNIEKRTQSVFLDKYAFLLTSKIYYAFLRPVWRTIWAKTDEVLVIDLSESLRDKRRKGESISKTIPASMTMTLS